MSGLVSDELPYHRPKAMKQWGSFEGLDNRKTLWRGLDRLGRGVTPMIACARRRKFLAWCATQTKWFTAVTVDPKTVGLVAEVYWDMVAMAAMYGLDLEMAAIELERILAKLR